MTMISKNLVGILFGGAAAQVLASAAWKDNLNAVYGFTSAGTGYQVFKPGNTFNSLAQLVPDGMYILDVRTPGFELPGAVLTAAAPAPTALLLENLTHRFDGGSNDNLEVRLSSPEASDKACLVAFDSPGNISYRLTLDDTITFSVPNVHYGQVVTLTAVAPSGARLTHSFTVGEGQPAPAPPTDDMP